MIMATTLALYGYGTSEGVRKAWDTRGRGRKSIAEGFVSPNVEENLTFEQAWQKLDSGEQHKFLSRANNIVGTVDTGTVHSAVGDWSDGAENSAVVNAHNVSMDKMRYMVALMARDANQKQAIAFVHDRNAADSIYTMHSKLEAQAVRGVLNSSGLQFRTLTPEHDGTKIEIFDQGTKLRDKVHSASLRLGSAVEFAKGRGEFIGGESREEGRTQFDKIISDYEKKHPEDRYIH